MPAYPDFIALDIKTSPAKYKRLLPGGEDLQLELFGYGSPVIPEVWPKIVTTLEWIASSGVEYEIRTTAVPDLVNVDDVKAISDVLQSLNVCSLHGRGQYVLAGFKPDTVLDPAYASIHPYPAGVLETMAETARSRGLACSIRSNRASGDLIPRLSREG